MAKKGHKNPRPMLGAILVAVVVGGCAVADTPGALHGQSGPFAWEVSRIRQARQEDGTEITWWFTLVLRNTTASVIALRQLSSDLVPPRESWGGKSTEPFVRRVRPGDAIRLDEGFSFSCRGCDQSDAESVFRHGIVRILEFEGEDEQGRSVRAPVRIRLDSATGAMLK
jgi:hypothetical protein